MSISSGIFRMKATSTVLLMATLTALPSPAQTFAEITGIVSDVSGAPIAEASVAVTNQATNLLRSVRTNESGIYRVPFLLPGRYEIRASHPGLKSATRSGFELQLGDVARGDFVLEVGAVTEVVEVQGAAPLVESETTAVGTVIENKRIVELPLNGRNYLQLVRLTPNVAAELGAVSSATGRQGGERAAITLSVAGQRQQFNRYTLDGVENTDVNYNTFVVRPSLDALQEFTVQTGVYSAEFGRASSQINVTTKSGSNEFHGSLFAFHRNENLDAREWRQVGTKNPFVRNQYGFTLGGPLIRDRLFFLSNFEGLRDRRTTQATANVPTQRMREGDFTQVTRRIFDPLTRTYTVDTQGNERAVSALPFPNSMIPRNRFNKVSTGLLEFYPAPTVPGEQTFRNFIRQRSGPVNWDQFLQRVDWSENAGSTWFGRFSWGDEFVRRNETFEKQEGRTLTNPHISQTEAILDLDGGWQVSGLATT